MKNKYYILLFLCIFNTQATEVDSFSQRGSDLMDSTIELNELVNKWLIKAMLDTNRLQNKNPCNTKLLVKTIAKKFTHFGWSHFEKEVINSSSISQHKPAKNHIYSGFNTTLKLPNTMTSLLNVNNVFIGADKFSHFFNEGFNNFKSLYWKKFKRSYIFEYGHKMETGLWGLKSTGIYSHADLVSNFEGFRFFESLTKTETPFFTCQNGTWEMIRKFKWENYINNAWDEGINCNTFKNSKLENIFHNKIKDLEQSNNMNLTCPIDYSKCLEVSQYYKDVSPSLISSKCQFN